MRPYVRATTALLLVLSCATPAPTWGADRPASPWRSTALCVLAVTLAAGGAIAIVPSILKAPPAAVEDPEIAQNNRAFALAKADQGFADKLEALSDEVKTRRWQESPTLIDYFAAMARDIEGEGRFSSVWRETLHRWLRAEQIDADAFKPSSRQSADQLIAFAVRASGLKPLAESQAALAKRTAEGTQAAIEYGKTHSYSAMTTGPLTVGASITAGAIFSTLDALDAAALRLLDEACEAAARALLRAEATPATAR